MTLKIMSIAVAIALWSSPLLAQQTAPKTKVKAAPKADVLNGGATDSPNRVMGFDGNPSSLIGCTGGKFNNTHSLGYAGRGTRIKVEVISGDAIDPIAALTVLQMGSSHPEGGARASYVFDDDGGGNLDPRIEMALEYDGNVVLSVGSFGGEFGCYWVKIQVTPQ